MFDRFTDDARKVMALALKEAQRLQHDCIATEHIAIGVIDCISGDMQKVLSCLDVSPALLREAILRDVVPGTTVDRKLQLPFTPPAKRALVGSMEAANELGHAHIGTEHLLVGLLSVHNGVAERLIGCGLEIEKVKAKIVELFGQGAREPSSSPLSVTVSAFNRAIEAAVRRGHEIRDGVGRERARIDNSVSGRPRIIFLDKSGQPGPSLWVEATAEGALRLVEDREPHPLKLEIVVGPAGQLRLADPGSAAATATATE